MVDGYFRNILLGLSFKNNWEILKALLRTHIKQLPQDVHIY